MKKIFLLDDEIQVREGIKQSINWTSEGFEYCGDAPDGEIALPLIKKYKPDIVITDIKMPFMDGLELSRILRSTMPWIKIIILSGHDEFEYAREAMRIQINEYCLKPINSTELLTILHDVARQIDQEHEEKSRLNDLESLALQNESLTRATFLHDICEGSYPPSTAIQKATENGVRLVSRYYCVFIMESISNNREILLQDNVIPSSCIHFKRNGKESVFILQGDSKETIKKEVASIQEHFMSINKKERTPRLLFGFGQVEERIQGIATSFSEADEEISYYRILQKYRERNPEQTPLRKDELHFYSRKELIRFLEFGDREKINEFSDSYSLYLQEIHNPFTLFYFLLDFTITVKYFIQKMRIEDEQLIGQIQQLEMAIEWIREYEGALEYMEKMLLLVFQSKRRDNDNTTTVIRKAKDFIHVQYHMSSLSLQTIAEHVHVSSSYFSHLFSQNTGQTLIEYITTVRIDKAKELIRTTRLRTYEVANRVGYNDSHYFCNLFKKVTGMTTSEYRFKNEKQVN